MALDYNSAIKEATDAASLVYDTTYGFLTRKGIPSYVAAIVAGVSAALIMLGRVLYLGALLLFVSFGSQVAISILQTITQIRKDGANDFAEVTAEAVGEFMAIDIEGGDFSVGKGKDAARQRAQKLGKPIHEMLIDQFAPDGKVTPETGEQAARAFTGYVTNFATGNAFMSILSEILTLDRLEQFKELGVEIAENLGLGRLHRRAMQPLIANMISKPYDRLLRARYRQDFISEPELVKAMNRGSMSEASVRTLLAQKGYPDDQISEIIAQKTPGLNDAEITELLANGVIDETRALGMMRADGLPDSIAGWRLQLSKIKRASHFRRQYLDEALSLAQDREIDKDAYRGIVENSGLPEDEQQSYLNRLGLWLEIQHRKLSKLDVLFLYEHGQFTLDELDAWMNEQGYSPEDQLRMTVEFAQKGNDFAAKQAAASSLKPKALHNQRVAFVTREWESIFGSPIPPDRLTYYVGLLDSGERTRTDVTAELKLLAGK